jgi:hypothetical protein
MNELARLLKRKRVMRGMTTEADSKALMSDELEEMLKRFEENEIGEAQFSKVTFGSPVLLLLA